MEELKQIKWIRNKWPWAPAGPRPGPWGALKGIEKIKRIERITKNENK